MFSILRLSGGINALARQLGEPPSVALAGAEALLPGLLAGFRNFTGGFDALLGLLNELGGDALAAAIMSHEAAGIQPGLTILERLSGVADAGEAPVDAGLRERMLPLLAMLVGGYLAARASAGALQGAELARLLEPGDAPLPPGDELV